MNLTDKELTALEKQLEQEKILIKKYRTFSQDCQDAMLKSVCNRIADKHQQHFNTMVGYLQ